ncbi:MAG: PDZ domain-containing protein [Verrucomicrobia bacterium]|nr:PDZ domain-containing protein [Verrucomicrobiota bacterium]
MDLTQFQFDFDLTFGTFFMNADKTIYGRFGSRSDRKDAMKDMTLDGFRKALAGALELHKQYPAHKASLETKRGPVPRVKVPEEYPSLKGRYKPTLDYEGKVVQSCMHCHQVRDAERLSFRAEGKPIPDEVLYPWPMPDVVGLALDPKEKAVVKTVVTGSSAERDGFKPGDEILRLEGQPLLSIADVQWVLHNAPPEGTLKAEVLRRVEKIALNLTLRPGWRARSDISWRVTSWDLRRMATGGLLLRELPAEERQRTNLPGDQLSLFVEHVGEYGDHAVAKRAGFLKRDIVIEVDGQTGAMTESRLFGYLLQKRMPGAKLPVTVLRNGERIKLELALQ